jgi:hypothetical protein
MARPKLSNSAEEIEKAKEQIDQFSEQIKSISMDETSKAPLETPEPQTKLSNKEIRETKEIYLKPKRTIFPSANPKTGKAEEFNEKFRKEYEYRKEYVKFIAENHEVIGESIPAWTKPYAGIPAEEWDVPVNKPVWGPRHLVDQIARKCYTRFVMEDVPTTPQGSISYYGAMVVESRRPRLSARRVENETSVSFARKVG